MLGDQVLALQLKPHCAVVPIVAASRSRPVDRILGSGFLIGSSAETWIVTAKHVFAASPLAEGERYAFVMKRERGTAVLAMSDVRASPSHDIAVGRAPVHEHMSEAVRLPVARTEPGLNDEIFCFEYSSSRIRREVGGRTHVSFEPFAHKGNIVRSFRSTYPEATSTSSYLTSFPALQGASGAPLLVRTYPRRTFAVVGVVVANYARHLVPAQVERIDHEEGQSEETRYYLPYGKALGLTHLSEELALMGVPFRTANIELPDPIRERASRWLLSLKGALSLGRRQTS